MNFRQVHLDFHTSGEIPGVGSRFSKKDFQKDRAELLLGVCYEKMNQLERAKNFYIQSMTENRHNRYYPTIRDRLANIEKKLAKQQQQKEYEEQ